MKNLLPTHKFLLIWSSFGLVSLGLIWASWQQKLPMSLTEVFGFISGIVCVWLTVKENIWNWPIGILNSAFFVVLFWNARLFADMGLQVVYIILGILGWYWWLKGGAGRTVLKISRTPATTWAWLLVVSAILTCIATRYLQSINDAAPFLDALTTVMSLVAQYLLTKKFIENWFVWISVDVIYIGLYIYKHLYLTGGLYVLFLLMCIAGWKTWNKLAAQKSSTTVTTLEGEPVHV